MKVLELRTTLRREDAAVIVLAIVLSAGGGGLRERCRFTQGVCDPDPLRELAAFPQIPLLIELLLMRVPTAEAFSVITEYKIAFS